MKNNNLSKDTIEMAVLSLATVLVIVLSVYYPMLYLVSALIIPLPFSYIYLKYDFKHALTTLLITVIISSIVTYTHAPVAFVIGMIFGGMGMALSYSSREKFGVLTTIISMALVFFISSLILYRLVSIVTGADLIEQAAGSMSNIMTLMGESYEKIGIPREKINEAFNIQNLTVTIRSMIPATLLIYSITASFVIYKFAGFALKKAGYYIKEALPISDWIIPRGLSMLIFFMLVISYILGITSESYGRAYSFNAFLIFSFVFSLDAVSVISFFLKKLKVPTFARVSIIAFLIISPLNSVLMFIGMVDYILDFRRIKTRRA